MAIYHLSARTGSRKHASSAKAKAQYILREGRYAGDSEEVLFSESSHMPTWAVDDAVDYWDMADCYERANGRLFKELEVALPIELNLEQQIELSQRYVRTLTEGENLPYTLAIHEGGGGNPHFHVMISPRRNDDLERPREQWCRRYNAKNPEKGGAKKTAVMQHRDWLAHAREAWTAEANLALKRLGRSERISHLSLADQGIERTPQIHRGSSVDALEARGFETGRGDRFREIERKKRQLERLQREAVLLQHREDADRLLTKEKVDAKLKSAIQAKDFRSLGIRNEVLRGLDLQGADFTGASLFDVRFVDVDLSSARFERTSMERVRFEGCVLQKAQIQNSILHGVDFEGADLSGSMWRGIDFAGELVRVSMKKANVQGCTLDVGKLQHLDLRWVRGLEVDSSLSQRMLKNNGELNASRAESLGLREFDPKEGVDGIVMGHMHLSSVKSPTEVVRVSVVQIAENIRVAVPGPKVREVGTRLKIPPVRKGRGFER